MTFPGACTALSPDGLEVIARLWVRCCCESCKEQPAMAGPDVVCGFVLWNC